MNEFVSTCILLSPEILLVAGALWIMVLDLFTKEAHRSIQLCAALGLASSLLATIGLQFQPLVQQLPISSYVSSVMAFDPMALYLKTVILILALGTVALSYGAFREEARHAGEYYCLLLFSTLGALVACSSRELLTFFISFELLSLPLYMLAGFRRYDALSAEAGLKYFLTGAVSSAVMLFGISWIYGSLGTTEFSLMAQRLQGWPQMPNALMIGLIMVIVGLAFKVSAAPFHNWAPDVYAGAPTVVNTFLSTVPKAAMAGVILRLFWLNLNKTDASFFSYSSDWAILFVILSLLSMFIGNLSALSQVDAKRLLAYSGVAQIGYLLMGLAACARPGDIHFGAGANGVGSVLFYVAAYTFSNFLSWAAIYLACKAEPDCGIGRFSGLFKRSPLLALALLIGLMSLAGVPPLVGFIGKFSIFRAIYKAGMPILVLFGILNSVISLYYYFKILRAAFFQEARGDALLLTTSQRGILWILMILVVGLGLWPGLLDHCFEMAQVIFK